MEDLFNFSISSLIAGLLFGIIGWWLFKEARKRTNNYNVVIGVVLMIYPYFVTQAFLVWATGALLCWAAYYFWDAA